MSRRPHRSTLFPYTTLFRSLTVKRTKLADGQTRREDLAHDLAKKVSKKEDLLVEILTRMDLPRRVKTSITDRKSTRLNSSHRCISYAVFCLKKKKHQKHKRY